MSISVLGIDIGKNNFHPPVTAPVNISHHLCSAPECLLRMHRAVLLLLLR